MVVKRIFDIIFSVIGLIILSPLFLVITLVILMDSRGSVFYRGRRVGRHQRNFRIYKFRTMYPDSETSSITVGDRDPRITKTGYWLRKYKLDEIPQLINVLKGEMSFVGPRPDVPDYKNYYLRHMPGYYTMKPGITSFSSLYFLQESKIYEDVSDPEQVYLEKTIPQKVKLDKKYQQNQNLTTDFAIIVMTIKAIFIKRR
ncbi:MAG: sugar transferase [Bacteroidales bacterium]